MTYSGFSSRLAASAWLIFAASAFGLDLVKDGKPLCAIVVSDAKTASDMEAAGWVQEYVQKATGARLPIVAEREKPNGAIISIGRTNMAREAGIGTDDLVYDGCKLIVRGSVLFLIGRDVPAKTKDSPPWDSGARGTCRAATRFIEDALGVRWLVDTPEGAYIPKAQNVTVADTLHTTFNPAFAYLSGRVLYHYGPALIANNSRISISILSHGGHSYYDWVPAEKYFKDHPEYFALINGRRTGEGNHLCVSNPAVRELLKQGLFADFDKGYEWVELNQEDGFVPCECPNCQALDDYRSYQQPEKESWEEFLERMVQHPCERLHLLHKWLIDEAKKQYPDRKVLLTVYAPTRTPSRKFDYYGDNVVLEICGEPDAQRFGWWKGKAPASTVYVYWFDTTLGLGLDQGKTPAQMARTMAFLRDNKVTGVYLGGGGEGDWGFMGPSFYVLSKLMGDPRLDHKVLFNEYCNGLYDAAAPEMKAFYELLYTRMAFTPPEGASYEDMQLLRYTPEFLSRLETQLAKAEAKANTERSKNFIVMTRDQFDFNKYLALALLAWRNYQVNPEPSNWQKVREAVAAFDRFRERVIHYPDDFMNRWGPGYGGLCNHLSSNGDNDAYSGWSARRDAVRARPLRGIAIGYNDVVVRSPLTLDMNRPPNVPAIK